MNEEKFPEIAEAIYEKGFCALPNFIDEEAVEALLQIFSQKRSMLREAGIGNKENLVQEKNIRGDKILWLEKNEDVQLDKYFFGHIELLMTALNRRCYLGLNDFEFHFAAYEPGTFYKRHKDVFRNDDARKISAILYLNRNWKPGDGGELMIYHESEIKVEPRAGTMVVFESHIEHEVLISRAERISVTGWLKSTENIL